MKRRRILQATEVGLGGVEEKLRGEGNIEGVGGGL